MAALLQRQQEAGQHSVEFVLLIGLTTIVAIVMQHVARQAVQTGTKTISDTVLGAPPPPEADEDVADLTTQDCDGATVSASGILLVTACSDVTEQGTPDFRRATTITESVRGMSFNEDARLQIFSDSGE